MKRGRDMPASIWADGGALAAHVATTHRLTDALLTIAADSPADLARLVAGDASPAADARARAIATAFVVDSVERPYARARVSALGVELRSALGDPDDDLLGAEGDAEARLLAVLALLDSAIEREVHRRTRDE